jgi:hypothetical protein
LQRRRDERAKRLQRCGGAGEMGRPRRQLAAAAARVTQECARALDRAGGDAAPDAAPSEMGDRQHRAGMDLLIGRRQDLLGLARSFEDEAGAAGAAHAQRIPARQALQPVIIPEERDQHLVRGCAIGRASRGGQDRIGLGAIRHHRRILLERHAPAGEPNRAGAGAQVAAAGSLRGRGRQQPLLGAQAPQHPAMPIAAAGMAHQDRHHDLVHREHRPGDDAARQCTTSLRWKTALSFARVPLVA